MAKIAEYRVRPVIRYIVTCFTSESDPETKRGSVGSVTIGEFENEDLANWVRSAMEDADAANREKALTA